MSNEIKAGKYEGQIIDYGMGTTRAGDPQVMILFGFVEGGTNRELIWYGSLREGRGREITIDALITCGLIGNDLSKIADGVQGGPLNIHKSVMLTVDRKLRTDENGTVKLDKNGNSITVPEIAWINPAGADRFRNKLTSAEARTKLGALNLQGDVMAARQRLGAPDPAKKAPADLPF